MKTLITILTLLWCVFLLSLPAQSVHDPNNPNDTQFQNLGTITTSNGLTWDHPATDLAGFNIYVALTNQPTNFFFVDSVATNLWLGDQTQGLHGWRLLYVTAYRIASVTNDLTLESELLESDPSETVLVRFRAGVPVPPSNIQIYSVVRAAATNALPAFSQPAKQSFQGPPVPLYQDK